MRIHIIYQRYIDEVHHNTIIGGLQTYIENLSELACELGHSVTIYQFATKAFMLTVESGATIIGVEKKHKDWTIDLLDEAEHQADLENDLLIFLTSTQIRKHHFKTSVCVQHGIYWDVTTIHGRNVSQPWDTLLRMVQSLKEQKLVKNVSWVVCVDYNYINWFRTQTTNRNLNYIVIPNFTEIAETRERDGKKVRIVFARRFEEIRGTELIMDVMPSLLERYQHVEFYLAGGGRLENELRETFKDYDRVVFTKYSPSESLDFHEQFDIAIVPTVGSEGTSLSLLEAMSAGCAVVCTDVGGMSNIILDRFNGRIIRPEKTALYEAISELIESSDLRKELADNARMTIVKAFSKDIWKNKWTVFLNRIINGKV